MRPFAYSSLLLLLALLFGVAVPAAATPQSPDQLPSGPTFNVGLCIFEGLTCDTPHDPQGAQFSRRCLYDSDGAGCTPANTPAGAIDGDDYFPHAGNTYPPGLCLLIGFGCDGGIDPPILDPADPPPWTNSNSDPVLCLFDPSACIIVDGSGPPDPPDPQDPPGDPPLTQFTGNTGPVTAVPEPPAWTMLLAGLTLCFGWLLARRRTC